MSRDISFHILDRSRENSERPSKPDTTICSATRPIELRLAKLSESRAAAEETILINVHLHRRVCKLRLGATITSSHLYLVTLLSHWISNLLHLQYGRITDGGEYIPRLAANYLRFIYFVSFTVRRISLWSKCGRHEAERVGLLRYGQPLCRIRKVVVVPTLARASLFSISRVQQEE